MLGTTRGCIDGLDIHDEGAIRCLPRLPGGPGLVEGRGKVVAAPEAGVFPRICVPIAEIALHDLSAKRPGGLEEMVDIRLLVFPEMWGGMRTVRRRETRGVLADAAGVWEEIGGRGRAGMAAISAVFFPPLMLSAPEKAAWETWNERIEPFSHTALLVENHGA
jgi:hypothetical protein